MLRETLITTDPDLPRDDNPYPICDTRPVIVDRWFNPYRAPNSDRARAVVTDVTGQVQSLESYRKLRQRARRPKDQEAFEGIVSAIVCDLIHFHLLRKDGGLVVTRSNTILGKRSRYRPQIYNQTFPAVLDRLATPEMEFVAQAKGHPLYFEAGPRRTTIRPPTSLAPLSIGAAINVRMLASSTAATANGSRSRYP